MYEISKISILTLVWYFVMYLVGHVFIAYMAGLLTNKYERDKKDKTEREANFWFTLFKWFPAVYVVFLLLVFYFG